MFRREKYVIPRETSLPRITPEQLRENKKFTEIMKNTSGPGKLQSAAWFVPKFDHVLKGGLRTVFMLAEQFSKDWETHNYIIIDNFFNRPENLTLEMQLKANFPNLRFTLIYLHSSSNVHSLPAVDAGFCTLWVTAYTLAKFNQCKAKFYLMQDYEPQFYASGSISAIIEHTYRLGFYFIANTPGVARFFKPYSEWGMDFLPGVDRSVYFPKETGAKQRGPFQIVFYGRPENDRNCFVLCIEALRIVKQELGNLVNIISVGAKYSTKFYRIDGIIENRGLLSSLEDVAALYRESDLGISLMTTPHPSYQPLEFMASGCPCLTNINESNTWLYKDRGNVVLTEPIIEVMAQNIIDTLHDHTLREKVRQGGIETIEKLTWDNSLKSISEFVSQPTKYQSR